MTEESAEFLRALRDDFVGFTKIAKAIKLGDFKVTARVAREAALMYDYQSYAATRALADSSAGFTPAFSP